MAMTEPAMADTGQFDFFLRVEVNDETAFFLNDSPPTGSAGMLRVRGAVRTAGHRKTPSFAKRSQETIKTSNGIFITMVTTHKEDGVVEFKADAKLGDQTIEVRYSSTDGGHLGTNQADVPPTIHYVLLQLLNPQAAQPLCGSAGIAIERNGTATEFFIPEKRMNDDDRIKLTGESWRQYESRISKSNVSNEEKCWKELFEGMICSEESPMIRVKKFIEFAAKTELPVLVLGEPGSGKDAVAAAIHACRENSGKVRGIYEALNCAELAAGDPMIILYKLFGVGPGHGVSNIKEPFVKGLLEEAENGTIFFDEIADMPYDTQTKLLRVFENREFRPAAGKGGVKKTNVYFVGATNKNLKLKSEAGGFRSDFYDRWKTISIKVLPLRQRVEDIPALVAYFTHEYETAPFAQDLFAALFWYPWPGNVRELKSLCRTLLAASIEGPVDLEKLNDLPLDDGLREGLQKAYERYEQVVKESDLGKNENQIINNLAEISAAMFPAVFEALATNNEMITDANFEELISQRAHEQKTKLLNAWQAIRKAFNAALTKKEAEHRQKATDAIQKATNRLQVVEEILSAHDKFKAVLLKIHSDKADALGEARTCFAMLMACYPNNPSLPKTILLRVSEWLKQEGISLSSTLHEPSNYGTYLAFFGQKYDAIREKPKQS